MTVSSRKWYTVLEHPRPVVNGNRGLWVWICADILGKESQWHLQVDSVSLLECLEVVSRLIISADASYKIVPGPAVDSFRFSKAERCDSIVDRCLSNASLNVCLAHRSACTALKKSWRFIYAMLMWRWRNSCVLHFSLIWFIVRSNCSIFNTIL